jgi:hypothetical protein
VSIKTPFNNGTSGTRRKRLTCIQSGKNSVRGPRRQISFTGKSHMESASPFSP